MGAGTRVVDEQIEPTKVVVGDAQHFLTAISIANIADDGDCDRTKFAGRLADGTQRFFAPSY
jgi:hypothetical protein